MILCVSPNTAVDRTMIVPGFAEGRVHRTGNIVVAAGGKGLNVARAIRILGVEACCAGFIGGHAGNLIRDLFKAEGLLDRWTCIDQETRTCVIIADPDAQLTTVVNENGPQVTGADWARLQDDVLAVADEAKAICMSGSVPAGTQPEHYTRLVTSLVAQNKTVYVDTSGMPLEAVQNIQGIVIKINDEEIGALLGLPVDTVEQVVTAAHTLLNGGMQLVVVTMGEKGAIGADATGTWLAAPPQLQIQSATGSGDSVLAALSVARLRDASLPDALREAVAAGTANALFFGGARFTMDSFREILGDTTIKYLGK